MPIQLKTKAIGQAEQTPRANKITFDVGYTESGGQVTGISVDPGSSQRFPLRLKVGPLEEAIQVTAAAPLLDTRDAPDATPASRGWMRFTAPLQQLLLRRAN